MDSVISIAWFVLGLVVLLLLLGSAVYPFVMLVDVLRRPGWQWRAIDRSKAGWAAMVFFGSFIGASPMP